MKIKILLTSLIAGILIIAVGCSTDTKKEKEQTPIKSLADVFTNLKPATQLFDVKPTEETLLKGKKGTVIYLPQNAFQFLDGTMPSGNVIIELKECYTLSDMIAENLSTTSENQLLQTAGMIYIKATAEGKELAIKNGKAFTIGFPKGNQSDTMDLFYDFKVANEKSTWIPDYKMYEAEAQVKFKNDTNKGEGDRALKLDYPVEMTDDLYDYGFTWCLETSTFYELKLKGQDKTILDYINDPSNISDSIAKQFIKNDWRVHLDFNIDKNGRMNSFRATNDEYTKYTDYAAKITEDFLKSAPAFDLDRYKDGVKLDWDYSLGIMGNKQINWLRFKNKFRDKFAEYKNKAIQKLDKTALDYYLFSATKMNWINCDKFWNTPDEKIEFFVKAKNTKDVKIQIMFTDINSIMNGTLKGDKFVFSNIPINRKIKVIGISYLNGKPTLSSALTKVDKDGFELTAFKEFSLDQLEEELNKKN